MSRDQLRAELDRLGCPVRGCGGHGYIFMPERSGGINVEGNTAHFWGCGVNAKVDGTSVLERLRGLPSGAGFARTWHALMDIPA